MRVAPDVLPELVEGIKRSRLGGDFERSPGGELNLSVGEQLETACKPAAGSSDSLGDGGQLASLPRVQHQDAVGLCEVALAQHESGYAV
jgi:hypothetical protein